MEQGGLFVYAHRRAPHLPHISPTSRGYLPHTSPTSPLHLPYIAAMSGTRLSRPPPSPTPPPHLPYLYRRYVRYAPVAPTTELRALLQPLVDAHGPVGVGLGVGLGLGLHARPGRGRARARARATRTAR